MPKSGRPNKKREEKCETDNAAKRKAKRKDTRQFFPSNEKLRVPFEPDVTEKADHWQQALNHSLDAALKVLALDRQSIVPEDVAKEHPARFTCKTCMTMNMPKGPHIQTEHKYELGNATSSDSVGPNHHEGIGGERHFVTFIDVANRFPTAIPVVSSENISKLIDATFNNFRKNYGHTPKIFLDEKASE